MESEEEENRLAVVLSAEEELYLATGIVLNNWFAVQVGSNECDKTGHEKQKLLEEVFWTAFNSIMSFKTVQCSWDDSVEFLESSMVLDMDVLLEDGSPAAVLTDLFDLYNMILTENRQDFLKKINTYPNKWHLINNERINFNELKVIRKPVHLPKIVVRASACSIPAIRPVIISELRRKSIAVNGQPVSTSDLEVDERNIPSTSRGINAPTTSRNVPSTSATKTNDVIVISSDEEDMETEDPSAPRSSSGMFFMDTDHTGSQDSNVIKQSSSDATDSEWTTVSRRKFRN